MGRKTKIGWCDATFNPVTGCLHGCEYCYARKIANRFSGHAPVENLDDLVDYCKWPPEDGRMDCGDCQKCNHVLDEPYRCTSTYDYMQIAGINAGKIEPYPYGFNPTFHRYLLDVPQRWKKPRNIFVCSMADLFGDWVPDEWIKQVFDACLKAPQHRYMFLTKNPKRYVDLANDLDWWEDYFQRDNFWFGSTVTSKDMPLCILKSNTVHMFVSVEPIQEDFDDFLISKVTDWVILGAETGNRKDKVIPEKSWTDSIVRRCEEEGVPIFMKESIRDLMGDDFRQEFPWEVDSDE